MNWNKIDRKTRPTKRGEWGILRMKKGFTLIELLVVIAIIAILTGIAFPVFARAKDGAFRSSDISKLNELRTSLQLYRTDQGGYPPALLGYVTWYQADGVTPGAPDVTANGIVPADKAVSALFPKRVGAMTTFQPSNDKPTGGGKFFEQFSNAVWPTGATSGAAGTSAQRDGHETVASRCVNNTVVDRYFYTVSGFDAAPVQIAGGGTVNEMHYSLFWSGYTVPANPCSLAANEGGSSADDPRQLGYFDPPDTSVVTWDTYFREYDGNGGLATDSKRDIVLFLGGSARMMPSAVVAANAWKVKP
ncbi:hypothetical protein BH11ARM1_BH11ARM1_15280 [soil metagenome]